ncbi:hypothetical protein FRC18_003913 [Serendipita sp. 400]|nr:hypothetical protein FRC18_003913 [Serendipita sp. 400]
MSINKLPPEIFTLILIEAVKEENGRPSTTASRHLLGICSQWRNLVTATANFWTNVHIVFKGNQHSVMHPVPTPNPDQVLEGLDLQLQRAGSQLIDVYLDIDVDAERAGPLFGLVFRRAPFCRWRSLELFRVNWDNYTLPITRQNDRFVNLEYMKKYHFCQPELLCLIDQTATSKLTVFRGDLSFEYMQKVCSNILSNISELELGMSTSGYGHFSPPPKVVNLTLPYFRLNDLCNVTHLKLCQAQSVTDFVKVDWTNVVSLDFVIGSQSPLPPAQQTISFPRLERLVIRGLLYVVLAYFSAPRLRCLQFDNVDYDMVQGTEGLKRLLSCSFLTLSPSEMVEILFPVNKTTLIDLIWQFPQIKRLKLHFEDDEDENEWWKHLRVEYDRWGTIKGTFCDWRNVKRTAMKGKTEAVSSRPTVFMENLASLEVELKWVYNEGMRETWRARMIKVLEDTQDTELKEIRCTWKGETPLELNRSELKTGNGVPEKVL